VGKIDIVFYDEFRHVAGSKETSLDLTTPKAVREVLLAIITRTPALQRLVETSIAQGVLGIQMVVTQGGE
jgi:hypothetical protein